MAAEPFERLVRDAEALADRQAWQPAAERWVAAAGLAGDAGRHEVAARLWLAAAEAFRRADLVQDALNALQLGMSRGHATPRAGAVLAAVLVEAGRPDAALTHARSAADAGDVLALDVWFATELRGGTRAGARDALARFPVAEPALAVALRVAQARLAVADGELASGLAALVALADGTATDDPARPALDELAADAMALQGSVAEAAERWVSAERAYERRGRRSLALRAHAARAWALADAGVEAGPGALRDGSRWAASVGAVALALELDAAAARVSRDAAALRAARDRAQAQGVAVLTGRIQLALAEDEPAARAMLTLTDAAHQLREHVPLQLRAACRRVAALADGAPAAAARAAAGLVTQVERAGMRPEVELLRGVEATCSST